MMTQTLQGKVMASYAPSSFSIRQQMSPSDFEVLQLDNMDQSTSPIRGIIIQKM
jgi:E1A/CREB-binding protein